MCFSAFDREQIHIKIQINNVLALEPDWFTSLHILQERSGFKRLHRRCFPLSFKVFRETSNWCARVWPMTLTIGIPPYYSNYSKRYAIEGNLVLQAWYCSLSSIELWKCFHRLNYESVFRVYPNTQKLCENIQDFNTWNPGRLFCKTRVDKMFLPLFEQIVHHCLVRGIDHVIEQP